MNVPGAGGRAPAPLTGQLVTLLAREHQSVLLVASPADNARQAFIPATEALRSAGAGPTVVVSPHLHALDKASAAARQHGLTTHMVSSRNRDSGDETYAALAARKVDILLITEKRLANAEFERLALPHLLTTGLLVLDEAETISRSYGGFTRGYAHAVHRLLDQAPGAAVLALSGSGTYDVVSDLNAILGPTSITVRHPILDTSLNLAVVKDLAPAARIAWATDAVEAAVGPAIVYARDQREAELLTGLLKSRGQAVYVHDPSSKAAPTADETPPGVIVTYAPGFAAPEAWPAFTTVVRTRPPMSLTSYHDQLTRSGSLASDATATILVAPDAERRRRRPEPSTGRVNEVAVEVLMELRAADVPRNAEWLEDATNASLDLVGLALRRLRDGGAVAHEGELWRATESSWSAPVETERPAKPDNPDDIKRYLAGDGCLMELIAAALGESDPGPCGRCTTCARSAPQPGPHPHKETFLEAARLVRLKPMRIPVPPSPPASTVARFGHLQGPVPGFAVMDEHTDAFGRLSKEPRAPDAPASELLVGATRVAYTKWREGQSRPPSGIVASPSFSPVRMGTLVRALAAHLGLRRLPEFSGTPPPYDLERSRSHHIGALLQALRYPHNVKGHVLLVTETTADPWTLLIASHLLREAGAGKVTPMALLAAI